MTTYGNECREGCQKQLFFQFLVDSSLYNVYNFHIAYTSTQQKVAHMGEDRSLYFAVEKTEMISVLWEERKKIPQPL